jgi:NADPH-dependent curcumin reductase CurA
MVPTQARLKKVPDSTGRPEWEITEHALPPLEEGQIRLQLRYISIDPGMMGWITAKRSYMPAVNEGEVMRAFGVGEVVESRSDRFPVGSFATGFTGVQTGFAVIIDEPLQRNSSRAMNIFTRLTERLIEEQLHGNT